MVVTCAVTRVATRVVTRLDQGGVEGALDVLVDHDTLDAEAAPLAGGGEDEVARAELRHGNELRLCGASRYGVKGVFRMMQREWRSRAWPAKSSAP